MQGQSRPIDLQINANHQVSSGSRRPPATNLIVTDNGNAKQPTSCASTMQEGISYDAAAVCRRLKLHFVSFQITEWKYKKEAAPSSLHTLCLLFAFSPVFSWRENMTPSRFPASRLQGPNMPAQNNSQTSQRAALLFGKEQDRTKQAQQKKQRGHFHSRRSKTLQQ